MGSVMFYKWNSLELFESWHESAKTALGIPFPGRNMATGEIDESAQWTTSYTDAIIVSVDDVRAFVSDQVANLVPDGLGQPSEKPVIIDE